MPADRDPERFTIRIAIHPADIDQLGHVNNVVYLRWVQDAAVAHWTAAAPPADQAALAWVVLRHEIDYRRPAVAGDTVLATTWVGSATRFAFDRHTELTRARDGKVLARARTVWCPIDRATRRRTDVSAEVRARFSVPTPRSSHREARS
jgi:acyl-CoA thioester hydrolase